MHFKRIAVLAVLFCFGLVFGQVDAGYDGTWLMNFDGKKTADIEGRVVINGSEGSWSVTLHSSKNPCFGRDYPVTVKTADANVVVFEVSRAKVLSGCRDATDTFNRVDAKTLKGEIGEGRTATLRLQ